MILQAGLAVVAATLVVGGGRVDPAELAGEPLRSTGGLRLLVADDPPFIFDVDRGRVTRVRGITGNASILGVGGGSAVALAGDVAFAVDARGARASRLGPALAAVPVADGRAVWLKVRTARGCGLQKVRLDGARLGPARVFPCGWSLGAGGRLGVVARRTQVLDPRTGRTIFRARWGVLAAVGERLLLKGPGQELALVDARSGGERRLPWPSALAGVDAPAEDPRGRYAALAFASPAWPDERGNTIGQVLDLWVIDTHAAELTQVPGFPAFVGLKATSIEWTNDGRLVVLGEDDRGAFVAVWRPGERLLSLKRIKLPRRSGYSDSFASLD